MTSTSTPRTSCARITPRTKAICAVHYAGYAADVERLREICAEHGLALIEDAAHAPSATAPGSERKLGTHGLAGCFSFFSNKVLSCGEGGLLATDDDDVAALARSLRSHAMTSGTWDRHRGHSTGYDVLGLGFNYRIDEPRAALLHARLPRTRGRHRRTAHGWSTATERRCSTVDGVSTVPYDDEEVDRSSCYVMPAMLDDPDLREPLRARMLERGVQTSVLYPAIHEFTAYASRRAAAAERARRSRRADPAALPHARRSRPGPCPRCPARGTGRPAKYVAGVSESLRRLLGANPSVPLLLVAVVLFVWIGADEGGFYGTTFLPATLVLLALLLVGLFALPTPHPSPAQWTAIGLIAGYALWSYLSILWADQQGLAWDGANRTAMYAIAFALFALWPIRGRAGAAVAATYALGVAGLGMVELIRASGADNPIAFLNEGRLSEPTGYANANVALWMTAFWPALLLAGRREVPTAARGLLLGSAGLLAALAMLGQSRGWVVIMPAMALLAVAVIPGRGRTIGALGLVAVAIAAISGPLLDVFQRFDADTIGSQGMDEAARATLVAFVLLTFAGIGWALADRAPLVGSTQQRRLGTVLVVGLAVACLGGLAAFSVVRGNPVTATADAWNEFKDGDAESSSDGARLGTLGGSYRYDYWRVAWHNFEEHPLTGVGADNFGREYLVHGESRQTPSYPHSVEMRTLSQTGLIGVLLLVGGIVAALVAAARPIRREKGIAPVAAGVGVVVFAYFIAHGSLDWFWEFPALGGPAFALLGLATAISTRPDPSGEPPAGRAWRRVAVGVGAVLALALALSLVMPWLAERELRSAREVAAEDPAAALAKLDRAADLNPLSSLADKTAAVIERQQGDLPGAEQRFRETLEVDPGDPFVYLQLAALASAAGRDAEAVRSIRHARALNPRDAVTRRVQRRLEAGRSVTPAAVDRMILRDVEERIGPD